MWGGAEHSSGGRGARNNMRWAPLDFPLAWQRRQAPRRYQHLGFSVQQGRAGLLTGLLGARSCPVVECLSCHSGGVKLQLIFLSSCPSSFLSPPPPKFSKPASTSQNLCPRAGVWRGSQCSRFSCRMVKDWNVGESCVANVLDVNVRQWLIFNPLHTRP